MEEIELTSQGLSDYPIENFMDYLRDHLENNPLIVLLTLMKYLCDV